MTQPAHREPGFRLGGDKALYMELGDSISPEVNRRVRGLVDAIDQAGIPGVYDLAPTYRSILVCYDPLFISLEDLKRQLTELSKRSGGQAAAPAKIIEIPTLYGGEHGPDLEFVASHATLSAEEVIRIHTSEDYLVYTLGFNPGFAYLGGMSERIAAPRLPVPRMRIPAGSVGIGETQTGVYPLDSPGGWRLIGKTPMRLFDPDRDPPVFMQAGDYVRFVRIDEERFQEIKGQSEADTYRPSIREKRD